MTLTQWMSAFGGAIAIGLLIMLIFFLRWDSGADAHLKFVQEQVHALEEEWSSHGAKATFSYEDAYVRGFPFGTRVHLIRPTISLALPEGKVTLTGSFISFALDEEAEHTYHAGILSDAMLTFLRPGKKEPDYYQIHLSQVPELSVRAEKTKRVEWAAEMPSNFIINMQFNEQSGQYDASFPAAGTLRWQPVPSDIRSVMVSLLRFTHDVATGKR